MSALTSVRTGCRRKSLSNFTQFAFFGWQATRRSGSGSGCVTAAKNCELSVLTSVRTGCHRKIRLLRNSGCLLLPLPHPQAAGCPPRLWALLPARGCAPLRRGGAARSFSPQSACCPCRGSRSAKSLRAAGRSPHESNAPCKRGETLSCFTRCALCSFWCVVKGHDKRLAPPLTRRGCIRLAVSLRCGAGVTTPRPPLGGCGALPHSLRVSRQSSAYRQLSSRCRGSRGFPLKPAAAVQGFCFPLLRAALALLPQGHNPLFCLLVCTVLFRRS